MVNHPNRSKSKWRPIEAHPKDAARVLLTDTAFDKWTYVGRWESGLGDGGGWVEDDGSVPDEHPTHWMPLPPPPSQPLAETLRSALPGVRTITNHGDATVHIVGTSITVAPKTWIDAAGNSGSVAVTSQPLEE